MHRTQIMLTDAQYELLRAASASSGRSLAELIRRAVDERYAMPSEDERLALLDDAFGGWSSHTESGEQFVERVRSGTRRRLSAA